MILLIDDERLVMQYYVRELKRVGFQVKQCFDPDSTFEFIEKKKPEISLIILDIMMLPGKKYQGADTENGLRTGLFILNDLRDKFPDVPIVVLTNVADVNTLKQFQGIPQLSILQKLDCTPRCLVQTIRKMKK